MFIVGYSSDVEITELGGRGEAVGHSHFLLEFSRFAEGIVRHSPSKIPC